MSKTRKIAGCTKSYTYSPLTLPPAFFLPTRDAAEAARIRSLSDRVIVIAQVARDVPITDEAWQILIDAGLLLRELAGLEPPWADEALRVVGLHCMAENDEP